MKSIKSIIILSLVLLLSSNAFASNIPAVGTVEYNKVVVNLLNGINSDNMGLKVSSAYQLGELQIEESVIPLLKMLRSSNTEEERIAAALSLSKINSAKAVYFVKMAARFDDSKRVRDLCEKFYLNSLKG